MSIETAMNSSSGPKDERLSTTAIGTFAKFSE